MDLRSVVKSVPFARTCVRLWRDLRRRAVFEDWSRTNETRGTESRSGPGSSLLHTEVARAEVPRLIPELDIASVLDIPCGDFHWMRQVDLGSVHYIGADIVGTLIVANQRKYGSASREFRVLDLTADELPCVDLIFCRDCLVHLSLRLIRKALTQIRHSGSRYLLTTTFPARRGNVKARTGDWRPINLCSPPFNLPPPIRLINERCPEEPYRDKSLGLWRVETIPLR